MVLGPSSFRAIVISNIRGGAGTFRSANRRAASPPVRAEGRARSRDIGVRIGSGVCKFRLGGS